MQVATKPLLTTGVALLGAGAIAVAPIQVAPPDVKVATPPAASTAVNLMADPVEFYTQLFERSIDNVGTLAEMYLDNPTPVLLQILTNQQENAERFVEALITAGDEYLILLTQAIPTLLQTVLDDLAQGDVAVAVNRLLGVPLLLTEPFLAVVGAGLAPLAIASNNLNNVVQLALSQLTSARSLLSTFGPFLSTASAVGVAIQGVIDGAGSGDPTEIVNALINAPGVVADGFLNGGYLPETPGLLTPPGLLLAPPPGPIGYFLALREAIADAISPTIMATANASEPEAPAAADDTGANEGLTAADSLVNEGAKFASVDAGLADDTSSDDGVAASPESEGEEERGDATKTANGGDKLTNGNKVTPAGAENAGSITSDSAPTDEASADLDETAVDTDPSEPTDGGEGGDSGPGSGGDDGSGGGE